VPLCRIAEEQNKQKPARKLGIIFVPQRWLKKEPSLTVGLLLGPDAGAIRAIDLRLGWF